MEKEFGRCTYKLQKSTKFGDQYINKQIIELHFCIHLLSIPSIIIRDTEKLDLGLGCTLDRLQIYQRASTERQTAIHTYIHSYVTFTIGDSANHGNKVLFLIELQ